MEPTLPARYDWFSASAEYEPADLVDRFGKEFDAEPRTVRALNGYQRAIGLFRSDAEEVRIQWSDTGRPNVLASGFPAQAVFEVMRSWFPLYSLARGDVAVDFDDQDVFEVAHAAMRRLSHDRGISHTIRGDWETPGCPAGRTTYAGALGKSAVVRRLYEFAKCHGYGLPVRFELEIKPPSRAKRSYACMDAVAMVGSDAYSVELLRRLGFGIERLRITREPPPRSSQTWFLHLCRQYGPKLVEHIAAELGGDASRLGPAILAEYNAELERRRMVRAAARGERAWSAIAHGGQPLDT